MNKTRSLSSIYRRFFLRLRSSREKSWKHRKRKKVCNLNLNWQYAFHTCQFTPIALFLVCPNSSKNITQTDFSLSFSRTVIHLRKRLGNVSAPTSIAFRSPTDSTISGGPRRCRPSRVHCIAMAICETRPALSCMPPRRPSNCRTGWWMERAARAVRRTHRCV